VGPTQPAKLPGPWEGESFYVDTEQGRRFAADFLYEVRPLAGAVLGTTVHPEAAG
jgi:hypothetical protein